MSSTVSKYLCNQLAEECLSVGEKSSGQFDFTSGIRSQQLLLAACFAPISHSLLTPHRIHPPRCNTCASTSFLSHLHSILLIFPVNFQTTNFSYCQIAPLPAILNTTLTPQFPALSLNAFSIWGSLFSLHLFPRKLQHTTVLVSAGIVNFLPSS